MQPLLSISTTLRSFVSASLVRREGLLLAACLAGDLLLPRVLVSLSSSLSSSSTPPLLLRLGLDNATHAFLALLVWWVVLAPHLPWPPPPPRPPFPLPLYHYNLHAPERHPRNKRLELLAAFLLSSALDLDHFLTAGSLWKLHGALHLKERPPGHCLTTLFALTAFCWASIQHGNGNGNSGGRRERQRQNQSRFSRWYCCLFACCRWWPRKEESVRYSLLFLSATLSHQLRDALRRGLWFCHLGMSTAPIPFLVYLIMMVLLPLVVRRVLRVGEEEEGGGGGGRMTMYQAVAVGQGDEEEEGEDEGEAGMEMARRRQYTI